MKTIGMLGGMSWESTASYYRIINEAVKTVSGGFSSAKICLYSVDFAEIEELQRREDWRAMADILSAAARAIEAGGADFLLICTNTMHKVAPDIEGSIAIPLLHIADATAEELKKNGVQRVGLLGTRFTMEEDFYKARLTDRHGIDVVVPENADMDIVHRVIFEELCLGTISQSSRQDYLRIIDRLHRDGAEAVILGCTEIALLIQPQHTDVPLYDTTEIHAMAAVNSAMGSSDKSL